MLTMSMAKRVLYRQWPSTKGVRERQALDRQRTREERGVHAQLRPFARYLPQHEHDGLVEGLMAEARLRERIQVRLS